MNNCWKQTFKDNLETNYKNYWKQLIEQLNSEYYNNYFWLQCPSGYLFKSKNIRWGVDITFTNLLIFEQLRYRIKNDLSNLNFIMITHGHQDHFDIKVLNELSQLPIKWVIPEFLRESVLEMTALPEKNILWINKQDKIKIDGIEIETFDGLHWDDGDCSIGVKSLGYMVNTGEKKILFAGDVRDYSSDKIPFKQGIDYLISHVWLGRGNSLNWPWENYLCKFCKFIFDINPNKVFLTHLYDTTRVIEEMWTYSHCGAIMDQMTSINPEIEIEIPRLGKGYPL